VIASLLGTGEVESFAQRIEQRHAWVEIERVTFAIDLQVHFN